MLIDAKESAHVYPVEDINCIGILHHADGPVGVLLVVGGPQYRVGSHRQYVTISRQLADAGIPSFRFDARGMGDSIGTKQTFDNLDLDIKLALEQFEKQSGVTRFVILGLCDAASASLMYAWQDKNVEGMVLINPWLKNNAAQGQVMLKHYYPYRLFSMYFWKRLLTGKVYLLDALKDAFSYSKKAIISDHTENLGYESKMRIGANSFQGRVCLVISGNDLTAKEFEQITSRSEQWRDALSINIERHSFSNADHTFSEPIQEKLLLDTIISFVKSIS